jgi:hypothetical protein
LSLPTLLVATTNPGKFREFSELLSDLPLRLGSLAQLPGAPEVAEEGATVFPVIEDGDFEKPVSRDPVIIGMTDRDGVMKLPNRPVVEVKTLNGFHRGPNPFGNMNVMGNRGEFLVRVTKYNRPEWFFLEIYDYNIAWFRGQKDEFTIVLRAPYGSLSSPLSPTNVKVEPIEGDKDHVRVTWTAPKVVHEQQYLERVIGYRVYRRIGSMTLNDRPWFPVATLGPNTTECVVDLRDYPEDTYWYSRTDRFAVSSLGELSMESELVEAPLPPKQ